MQSTVRSDQSIGTTAVLCAIHPLVHVVRAGRPIGIVTAADCQAAVHFGLAEAPIGWITRQASHPSPQHIAPSYLAWADLAVQFPPALVQFLEHLTDICVQHGVRLFLVGGVVRALFRREVLTDLDVAIVGDFASIIDAIANQTGGMIVQRSAFQTASLTFPTALQPILGMTHYDVVAARSEHYAAIGALPSVVPAPDIAVDLRRRDLTINAMAVELLVGAPLPVHDPFGGWADVHAGQARMVHPLSFFEDPTRLIRLARITARLQLQVDTRLRRLITWAVAADVCATVSRYRWLQELLRTCDEADPAPAMRLLQRWGVLAQILPGVRVRDADHAALIRVPPTERLLVLLWRMPLQELAATVDAWTEFPVAYRELVALRQTRRTWRRWLASRPSRSIRALAGFDPVLLRMVAILEPTLAPLLARNEAIQAQAQLRIKGRDLIAAGVPAGPAIGVLLERLQTQLWDDAWAGVAACDTAEQQLACALQMRRVVR